LLKHRTHWLWLGALRRLRMELPLRNHHLLNRSRVSFSRPLPACSLFLLISLSGVACQPPGSAADLDEERAEQLRAVPVPAEFQQGEALFERHCSSCHGEKALGTESGPPLVHIVYEPSHHADFAFYMAVTQGVRAHHWRFGDMPPVPGLQQEEISQITSYIRWLQRQVGIH
jgi:mono/diheme cytochrome c family protein